MKALFLGRIAPVKGLPVLIEAWRRVRPQGWVLQIAGPDERGHREQVERAVSAAGLQDVVSFAGSIKAEDKESLFRSADLFVLPTYSESFGVAVGEALAHGLPVLTTRGAPWSVLKDCDCGWWVEATVNGLEDGLRQATSLDKVALRTMGNKGRSMVIERFSWERVAVAVLSTYRSMLGDSAMNGHLSAVAHRG
jgi:glycosyltransferase involved in cell wall biosynthesis